MPSRLLREGILDSDRIEKLDWAAEVFYRRLMSKVDDYGLFDARPSLLRTSLFPLRVDRVREADISRWLVACEAAGVIALYVHGGKPYGQMLETRWQARSEPKHPLPPWGKGERPRTGENSCAQPLTVVPVFVFGVEDVKPPPPPLPGGAVADSFAEFWSGYPASERKVAEEDCRKKWHRMKLDAIAAEVLAGLRRWVASPQWQRDGGAYIPAPLTWLTQRRWEAEISDEIAAADAQASRSFEATQALLAEQTKAAERAKSPEAIAAAKVAKAKLATLKTELRRAS